MAKGQGQGGLKRLWRRFGVKSTHERVYVALGLVAGLLMAPALADSGRSGNDNLVETFVGSGWTRFVITMFLIGIVLDFARRHPSIADRVRPERRVPVVSVSLDDLQRQPYFSNELLSVDRAALAACLAGQPELDADEPYGSLTRTTDGFTWIPADRFAAIGVPSLCIAATDVGDISAGSGNSVENCHFTNLHLVDGSTISFKTTVAVLYGTPKRSTANSR